jgi:hypothetical protein
MLSLLFHSRPEFGSLARRRFAVNRRRLKDWASQVKSLQSFASINHNG